MSTSRQRHILSIPNVHVPPGLNMHPGLEGELARVSAMNAPFSFEHATTVPSIPHTCNYFQQ